MRDSRPDGAPSPSRSSGRQPTRRARSVATGVSAVLAAGGVVAMAEAADTAIVVTGEVVGVAAGVVGERAAVVVLAAPESAPTAIPQPVKLAPEVGPGVS